MAAAPPKQKPNKPKHVKSKKCGILAKKRGIGYTNKGKPPQKKKGQAKAGLPSIRGLVHAVGV